MKSQITKYILLIAVFNAVYDSFSQEQKQISNQNLVWYGYFNTLHFNEKTFLTTEIQERHFIQPFAQSQLVFRTHFHRHISNGWDVAPGMCLFLQGTNDPSKSSITIPELRPHIEFNYKQKLEKISIEHRYKIEARFFHHTNSDRTALEDGFGFGNFRFRYRLQFTIPLAGYGKSKALKLKLKISDEIHVNAGSSIVLNTFDQNRIYGGINFDLSKSLSFEIGYLNWFQKRTSGADYYNRNILRFTLSQKINLSK